MSANMPVAMSVLREQILPCTCCDGLCGPYSGCACPPCTALSAEEDLRNSIQSKLTALPPPEQIIDDLKWKPQPGFVASTAGERFLTKLLVWSLLGGGVLCDPLPNTLHTQSADTYNHLQLDEYVNYTMSGNRTIHDGNNTIHGGNRFIRSVKNIIHGGNRTINDGDNTIYGGSNTINGGTNTIYGGSNNIHGGTMTTVHGGNNNLYGGGNNIIYGDNNTIYGGNNIVHGSNNVIFGGNNTVYGRDNTIHGGNNNIQE